MEQIANFGDQRQTALCVYCGGETGTRDHVPSRVLLDEPYPEELPVVPACKRCNNSFSADEEYVACLIECVIVGSAAAIDVRRDKIKRILTARPALASRISQARQQTQCGVRFLFQADRVRNVMLKLGRGHVAYELNEPQLGEPASVMFNPFPFMTDEEQADFESATSATGIVGWPEVGSRAMQRLVEESHGSPIWIVVQPGRYRYMTSVDDGVTVRFVLSEYLACEIRWP